MNETFKEIHLRSLYRLFGHANYWTRIASLDFSTKVVNTKTGKEGFLYEEEYVQGEEAVINYAKRYNGQRNVFISRAYRDANGAVIGTNCITFDLDPLRDKNTASTKEQNEMALQCGRNILKRYRGGYLASSGNGALLVYRLPVPIVGDGALKNHYEKEKVLIKELQEIAVEQVKIDSTNYSEAIVKAIGTMSTKGDVSLRRNAQWLLYPIFPYNPCHKLLLRLAQTVPEEKPKVSVSIPDLQSKFNGDRSAADYALVSLCKQSGIKPESALQALRANPLGRQTDERDQARLIAKIYGTGLQGSNGDTRPGGYFERLFTQEADSNERITTGFGELDRALGPLPSGELSTFAARSGFGKTTFGCTLAEYWRCNNKRVLFFSTEMASEYIMHKLVSLACRIDLAKTIQKNFTEQEITRIRAYEGELLRSPIMIVDTFKPTLQEVHNKIIQCKPDVLIFDHITQSSTSWQEIAEFTRGIKDVTTKENITTVLLSMLNEPPRKSDGSISGSVRGDVRGSQEIIFLSAIFCLLSNPYEIKGRYQPVNVLIAKNRYGISNQTIPLTCDKEISKFIERSKSHEPDEV